MARLGILVVAMGVVLSSGAANATVVPAPLFTDNAVLQRGMADPVWGTASPGETVTVSIAGQTASVKADAGGRWMLKLKPMDAGGPYVLDIAGSAGQKVSLNNVAVGEVWVCSGQSNMQMPLAASVNGREVALAAKDTDLRIAGAPDRPSANVESTMPIKWGPAIGNGAIYGSAVAYYFGRDLRKATGVVVGLIETYKGGTVAEAWTSREGLLGDPAFKPFLDAEAAVMAAYPDKLKAYEPIKAKYDADLAAAKAAGTAEPALPKPPPDPGTQAHPTHLYNGMVAPLIPYGIKGVVWYQGETNCDAAYVYSTLFPAMIADWRKHWGQGDFPFLYVQLPALRTTHAWAELREAQRLALTRSPNTAMVVSYDQGEIANVHPVRKEAVSARLALAARGLAYHEKLEYSGPVFDKIKVQGNTVQASFTHAEGLCAGQVNDARDDGPVIATPDKLVGFEVAGTDGIYHAADARIDGRNVLVTAADVPQPVAVRYAWADAMPANLRNGAGLWASPFRSVDFGWVTKPKVGGGF
ncbi:MAG TPA: sialate O-acetylesterase [Capsulimonadaceae bacterium]|jgi:sialate O-acetylesterase